MTAERTTDRARHRRASAARRLVAMLTAVATALGAAALVTAAPAVASTGGSASAAGLDGTVLTVEVLGTTIFDGFPIDVVSAGTPSPGPAGNGEDSDSVPSFSLGGGVVTGGETSGGTVRTTDALAATASVSDISLNFFGIPIVGADLLSSSVRCPIDQLVEAPTASIDDVIGLTLGGDAASPGDSTEIEVPVDTPYDNETVWLIVSVTSPTATTGTDASAAGLRIEIDFEVRVLGVPVLTVDFVDVDLAASTCSRPTGSAPAADGISPAAGPSGTTVTVTGSGFVPGATSVAFGALAIDPADVSVVTDPVSAYGTALSFEVPAGAPLGATAVTATTPAGTTGPLQFEVLPPAPTATALSPDAGPVGTTVTVTGASFVPGATSVTIAGVTVAPSEVAVAPSGASLTFSVPPGAPVGATTVVVTTDGGATSPLAYTVTEPVPQARSLSPDSGPVGTTVTIDGDGFVPGGTAVVVGDVVIPADQVHVASDGRSLSFVVPSGTPVGPTSIRVETAGGASGVLAFTVTASDGGGSGGGVLPFTGGDGLGPMAATGLLLACIGAGVAFAAALRRRRHTTARV